MQSNSYHHEDIYEPESLVDWVWDRANSKDGRKIAFLVGSPLTEPERGGDVGVANVTRMVDRVLREIESRRPGIAAELRKQRAEEVLDGELYQRAMTKLGEVCDESIVNRAVRAGVLGAVAPGAYSQEALESRLEDLDFLRSMEQHADAWSLRPGVAALGKLLTAKLPGFAPFVLTSNFDPLIEISIRRHGSTPQTVWFDRDGALDGLSMTVDPIKVIHLHGWWLEGDTLHTRAMLTAPRPNLSATMERLLAEFVIVPVAYGGWDDIFTFALRNACSSARSVDVRWGVYQRNKAEARMSCHHLLCQYPPNRVRFYRGVDCHVLFPALASRIGAHDLSRGDTTSVVTPAAMARMLPASDISSMIDWDAVSALRRAVEARLPGSTGACDDWSFLERNQGLLVRGADGRLRATTEAIILLGTKEALRIVLRRPIVDFQIRSSVNPADPTRRWAERENIEANLVWTRLTLLQGFVSAMRRELDDGTVRGPTSGVPTDMPAYIAFREAAVNMLVHQNYEDQSTKGVIEIGEHGWHFENSGCPNVEKADLISPTPIPYRNPLINRSFRDAGWTENGKTGLRAIGAAWMGLGRTPPAITLLHDADRFRLEFSFEERAPIQVAAWISQLGMTLTDVQAEFISLLATRKIHHKADYQLALGLPTLEFGVLLRWAELQGLLDLDALGGETLEPSESFGSRIPDFSRALDLDSETDAKLDIGALDDASIKLIQLLGDGLMTTPRFQDVTRLSRPAIRNRLSELLSLGLVRLDASTKTHIWRLTEAGERVAMAVAR